MSQYGFIENLMGKLIGDGIVTESELEQRIEEAKAASPIHSMQQEGADMFFQNAIQDFRIDRLEEENASLLLIIAGGMM